ncbi:hypothetical protein CHELA1G11_12927 [Hyphomicrobiales bacterium]|nr:hypothetical protein CHELA1G2_11383 [Hyphomicrobiales bacterium]CAH1668096.1 hypothetical protein CHELA1G11_12927 [Hyphomicrobiales bacterium]
MTDSREKGNDPRHDGNRPHDPDFDYLQLASSLAVAVFVFPLRSIRARRWPGQPVACGVRRLEIGSRWHKPALRPSRGSSECRRVCIFVVDDLS